MRYVAHYLSVAMSFQREVLTGLKLICRTILKTLHTHVDNTVRSRLNAAFDAGFLKRNPIPPRGYHGNDELVIAIIIFSISLNQF